MDIQQIVNLVGTATLQTLAMVFFSTIFSLLLGLPLGIFLLGLKFYTSQKNDKKITMK